MSETEPSLEELLSDPIARALMESDGLTVEDVIALLFGASHPAE
jgi:hypothetical protein